MAFKFEDKDNYTQEHGGAFDRGSADSYYGRGRDPHMWPEGTGNGIRINKELMSPAEIQAYLAGYQWNEQFGDKKSWD